MTPLLAALALALAPGAGASTPPGPASGWPCEGEVPAGLAADAFWPGAARIGDWRRDPQVAALVATVAPRSLPQEEAARRLAGFAKAEPNARDAAAAGLIATLDEERSDLIAGIRRFSLRQAQLAARVEADYTALDAPATASSPADRAALEEQAGWDARIFEDRQRLLPLVCRQPAEIETRLKALLAALRPPSR